MLRRRLTLAFVLVAGIAAGALATGSYVLVRDARRSDSLERAAAALRVDLRQAGAFQMPLSDDDIGNLLRAEESRNQHALLVVRGQALPSNEAFAPAIPAQLRGQVARGKLGYERIGRARLLVGGAIPGATDALYLVVSERALARDLRELREVLGIGWLLVVLGAGLVGRALARRTLSPVARAAQAARAIAGGSLTTRLPVERGDEFGVWAAAFNDMAAALEAKIAALDAAQAREQRFTADVAHELRTPLTAMVAAGSMLREHLDTIPPGERRSLELLIGDLDRLRRLVDELIEISRLDAGREDVWIEPLDLTELVRATLRARGWEARVAVDGEALAAHSDRRRVERIVANLVDNALVHGSPDGVRVQLRRDADEALIVVSDKGRGIAPEHREHLFERFYKADPSRTEGGSGLGLAIARENARLLGGDIEVDSEPGGGTQFRARFPVTRSLPSREPLVADEAHSDARPPARGTAS
ncbi:MAG: two-component system, OmpR family, sensor histidine kinase MtrB [Solirubrobacteraceae bacterium]|jgi:two-component system sensor histidine kinase MtrB|nr:two-component system, OmpR family, sensor histidine kinase MtrB [Solirubrobacteraceae bacterium]